jgi:hypothetical protein
LVALAVLLMQGSAVPVRSIEKGVDSQIDAPSQVVARSAAEWTSLWNRHAGERSRPAVDFSREMVVAVFLGSRPTAGFGIEIVSAKDEGGTLIVQYRETAPGPGRITAQVLTFPCHLAAVPRYANVRFDKVN